MLPDFRRDLRIRHLVHGLDTYDLSLESLAFKAFPELPLGFSRTEDLDGVGAADRIDDFIVIGVEMVLELAVPHILGRAGLRETAGISDVLLHPGNDPFRLLSCVSDNDNDGLPMVDPKPYFAFQRLQLDLLVIGDDHFQSAFLHRMSFMTVLAMSDTLDWQARHLKTTDVRLAKR